VGVADATAIAAVELGVHVGEQHYEAMLDRLMRWFTDVTRETN
jgi:hypothetical protein